METLKTITTIDGESALQIQTTTVLTKEQLKKTHYENSEKLAIKIMERDNLALQLKQANAEVEELTTLKVESLENLETVLPLIDRTIPDDFSFNPTTSEPISEKIIETKETILPPYFTNLK